MAKKEISKIEVIADDYRPRPDIVEGSVDDAGTKSLVVIRHFKQFNRLIIKISTTGSVITKIRLTGTEPYVYNHFSGAAFDFPTVTDFYRFAERADKHLFECLQPVMALGEKVTDKELANAILQYFDKPDCLPVYRLQSWWSETQYLHQSGVKISYYTNTTWLKYGTFHPTNDSTVDVNVEYAPEALLGLTVLVDRPDKDNNPLYRIKEDLYVVDAYAAMALQKSSGVDPHYIYEALIKKYAPFSVDKIEALRSDLRKKHIDYKYTYNKRMVEPKQLWHTIPIYHEQNPDYQNSEYVPQGSDRNFYIKVSHVEDIVTKVEFEDNSTTSGYWHDNPNYPFSHIISKTVLINQPTDIKRLAQSLQIADVTPKALMEAVKAHFTTLDSFISFLDSNKINYELNSSN